jgi:hypothetical protein
MKVMESNSESAEKLISQFRKVNYFKTLTPHNDKPNVYNAGIAFASYSELLILIKELLKVSLLAVQDGSVYDNSLIINPHINVASIIEIAIQLMPCNEGEALDACHKLYMDLQQIDLEKKSEIEGNPSE